MAETDTATIFFIVPSVLYYGPKRYGYFTKVLRNGRSLGTTGTRYFDSPAELLAEVNRRMADPEERLSVHREHENWRRFKTIQAKVGAR